MSPTLHGFGDGVLRRLAKTNQLAKAETHTTLLDTLLCRAAAAKKRVFEGLLRAVFGRAGELKLLGKSAQAAIDSTDASYAIGGLK
jgi:hypothetical protein